MSHNDERNRSHRDILETMERLLSQMETHTIREALERAREAFERRDPEMLHRLAEAVQITLHTAGDTFARRFPIDPAGALRDLSSFSALASETADAFAATEAPAR